MAPTVYISDLSCAGDGDSESSDVEQRDTPTYYLGFDVNDLRVRRRNHGVNSRRDRPPRPLMGLAADQSRRPTPSDQARTSRTSIDTADRHLTAISRHSKISESGLKSWVSRSTHCHRLLLLRRREGLLDITVRTVALIRRNQQLQVRLAALQAETRAFVQSVLSNPENAGVKLQKDDGKKNDISDSDGTADL